MPPVPCAVVAYHPAAGVAGVACEVGGGGGGHGFDGGGFEERGDAGGSGDVVEELDAFGGGGDPSAVRVHAGDVEFVGVFAVLAEVDDFVGGALALFVAGDLHGGDAAGREDVGFDVGVVRLAGDLFDDAAEDAVAEVGVGPVGAGLVGQEVVSDGFGDEFGVVPAVVVPHGVVGIVGPAAAGVGEELVDGDVGDPLLVGWLAVLDAEDGAGAEDFVGEAELALLDEGEDGDGGDGLGDGGDAEEGILGGLGEVLAVGHADGLVVDELAVAGDGDGGGGDGELAAEGSGETAHFAALLAGGTTELSLREGFDGGAESCGGGGEGEIVEESAAGEGLTVCGILHRCGVPSVSGSGLIV